MLTITAGDNKLFSPYTGADPLEITLSDATPGKWYELIVPTNQIFTTTNGVETTYQSWGYKQADVNGQAKFNFNASLSDPVVDTTHANGWLLPPGLYDFTVREYYNSEPLQTIPVQIVSEATTSIATATKNKQSKGKGNPH